MAVLLFHACGIVSLYFLRRNPRFAWLRQPLNLKSHVFWLWFWACFGCDMYVTFLACAMNIRQYGPHCNFILLALTFYNALFAVHKGFRAGFAFYQCACFLTLYGVLWACQNTFSVPIMVIMPTCCTLACTLAQMGVAFHVKEAHNTAARKFFLDRLGLTRALTSNTPTLMALHARLWCLVLLLAHLAPVVQGYVYFSLAWYVVFVPASAYLLLVCALMPHQACRFSFVALSTITFNTDVRLLPAWAVLAQSATLMTKLSTIRTEP